MLQPVFTLRVVSTAASSAAAKLDHDRRLVFVRHGFARIWCRPLFWLLISLFFSGVRNRADDAEDPPLPHPAAQRDFVFKNWQTDAGLPENSVTGLAQTADGYLWCATFNGLARFDGVRFEIFDAARNPEFPTSRLIAVAAGRNGTQGSQDSLVVQTEFGDLIVRRHGRFERADLPGAFTAAEAVVEDEAGEFWVSRFSATSPNWKPLTRDDARPPALPKSPRGKIRVVLPVHSFFVEEDGSIIRLANGRLLRLAPGKGWTPVNTASAGEDPFITLMAPGRDGLWLHSNGLLRLFTGREIIRTLPFPKDHSCTTLLEDPAPAPAPVGTPSGTGSLWVPGWNGRILRVDLLDSATAEITGIDPLHRHSAIRSLIRDREGSLWMGIDSFGLVQIRPRSPALRVWTKADGLNDDLVRSLCADPEGNLWAVTTAGLNRIRGTRAEHLPGAARTLLWSAAPAGPGRLWLSTYSSGLFLFQNGRMHPAGSGMQERWWDPDFTFLFTDTRGLLWFGNSSGLFTFNGTEAESVLLPVEKQPDIRAAIETAEGGICAASNGRGLFLSDPARQHWQRLGREAGLRDEQISCLHRDASGRIWIGTSGGGLARLDGDRITSFLDSVPDLPRAVTGLQSDDCGFLWLASTRGIYRVGISALDRAATNREADVNVFAYQRSSGLNSAECITGIQPSVAKTSDGRIWFATTGGLVSFDPAKIPASPLPPPVALEAVSAGTPPARLTLPPSAPSSPVLSRLDLASAAPRGGPLRATQGNPTLLEVNPGADSIEIQFTALSFVSPQDIRFRYRLEGLDQHWTTTRSRKAVYQRLPPGHYLFRVTACNRDGVWNEHGAALSLVQLPFFWQTLPFKAALVVAGAALIYLLHRTRLAQLEAMSRMRARIAADLHDEVGSNMGAVALNAELLKSSGSFAPAERQQLSDIHRVAQNTAQAIREISWFINPDFDFPDEMMDRMEEVAHRLFATRNLTFSRPEAVPKTRLSLEFRQNVMAIYKEALNNIARHSNARAISIAISVTKGRIELEIRDDGCGFDTAQTSSGQGLRNFRRRAAAINAHLEIKSDHGSGTCLRLSTALS